MPALLRPLSSAEILDGSFTLLRRHIGLLLGLSAVYYAAVAPLLLVVPQWVFPIVAGFLLVARDGSLLWASAQLAQGKRPTLGETLGQGLKLFIPLWLLLVLYTLAWSPLIAAGMLVILAATVVLGPVGYGLLLLFLPVGAFAFTSWFAWQQVLVVEHRFNFFRQSTRLARGARWKILGVSIVAWLIVGLPQGVVLGSQAAANGWDWDAVAAQQEISGGVLAAQWLIVALTRPFWILIFTLLYFDRRVRVDGLDVQQSVAQFERATVQP